jgi:uncharacterized protein YegP (UPF0339 family)
MAGKFEIYEDDDGGFRFRLRARNDEVVAVGGTYLTVTAAKNGIAALLKAAAGAQIVNQTHHD